MRIRRILAPLDFSEHSERALEWAVSMARKCDASLLLLHVVSPPTYPPMMVGLMDPTQFESGLREDAARKLKEAEAKLQGITAATRVRTGEPFHEICTAAGEEHADLVVMGSHGRTGLAHVLLGSVADRVVRYAPCPVMVVGRKAAGGR